MNIPYKQKTNSERGFTIIEVVLVLAIAGLIFLMVFIALPALQRSQRDTQRRDDVSRINTQIGNYQNSARGGVPQEDDLASFIDDYLGGESGALTEGGEYNDPSGGAYDLSWDADPVAAPGQADILYRTGSKCADNGSGDAVSADGDRSYSLRVYQEGNPNVAYCVDNS